VRARVGKGHFIAHSIGGAVDGWELNVFVQRRELNRDGPRRAGGFGTWRITVHYARPRFALAGRFMSIPQPNPHLWSSAYLKAMASSGWNVSITDDSRSSGAGRSTTYDMDVTIHII